MACIEFLIIAWILTLFNFDNIFVNGMQELFNFQISVNGYYLIFFLSGLILDIFFFLKKIIISDNY